jgi:predicted enzyme related to lactoylglutathione lyase
MAIRYVHTNIVSRDWRRLAGFYERVFGCEPVPPVRAQAGAWLERGTGVPGARLEGVHLSMPGCGPEGPTLEIYQYAAMEDRPPPVPNRRGYGHIAFHVDDVPGVLSRIVEDGGRALGQVTRAQVPGKGEIEFVYAADPEGNIIELQCWA